MSTDREVALTDERDIIETIELALQRGYVPGDILNENSPIRDRIRAYLHEPTRAALTSAPPAPEKLPRYPLRPPVCRLCGTGKWIAYGIGDGPTAQTQRSSHTAESDQPKESGGASPPEPPDDRLREIFLATTIGSDDVKTLQATLALVHELARGASPIAPRPEELDALGRDYSIDFDSTAARDTLRRESQPEGEKPE